jgi:hypothetical protein
MGFEIAGRLHTKNEAVQISERFRKREFVLEIEPESQYPQTVQFELTGDRCELLDEFVIGQELKVEFSLRGREWTSPKGEIRFFNSLNVWQVQEDGAWYTVDMERDGSVPPARSRVDEPERGAGKAANVENATQDRKPVPNNSPPPADDSIPF